MVHRHVELFAVAIHRDRELVEVSVVDAVSLEFLAAGPLVVVAGHFTEAVGEG